MRNKNRARSFMQVRSSRSRSKRGVSPVIGVILMVAATIVIAGVVMTMLGGFSPPKKTYTVSISGSKNSTGGIILTCTGGPDYAMVDYINLTLNGTDQKPGWGEVDGKNEITVGSSHGWTGGNTTAADHIVAVATFIDGTKQVVLDTYV